MKRSKSVKLVLIGGLSAGALTGCDSSGSRSHAIRTDCVYTNNFYVPRVGYYHAPFRAWYPLPYNYYDSQRHFYFYGGAWGSPPHQSITNISYPTFAAVQAAQPSRPIHRSGFGSTSRHRSVYS